MDTPPWPALRSLALGHRRLSVAPAAGRIIRLAKLCHISGKIHLVASVNAGKDFARSALGCLLSSAECVHQQGEGDTVRASVTRHCSSRGNFTQESETTKKIFFLPRIGTGNHSRLLGMHAMEHQAQALFLSQESLNPLRSSLIHKTL